MNLTSINRMLRYLDDHQGNTLIDSVTARRTLTNWITSVSSRIEQYMNRTAHLQQYTQYFDSTPTRTIYYPDALPIAQLTSVHSDASGLFNGSESSIVDAIINSDRCSIVIPSSLGYEREKSLRVVYTGGLAVHAVNSLFAFDPDTLQGSFTLGSFVMGQISGAVGIVASEPSSERFTIENLWGIFEDGETVVRTTTEGGTATSTDSIVIDSIISQSLVEAYPDIVTAVEMQIRYNWKHKHDFENNATSPDGESRRSFDTDYDLQPETKAMLAKHVRYLHP